MRQRRRSRQVLAIVLGLSLIAAACGDDDDDETGGGEEEEKAGVLDGVQGTFPAADSAEIRERLLEQDSELVDFQYGAESYDAVVVLALAAEAAKTDQPDQMARQINGITRDGEKCEDFATCLDMVKAGTDIDYDGQSGPLDFGRPGEPQKGTVAILTFGADNQLNAPEEWDYRDAELTQVAGEGADEKVTALLETGDAAPDCTGEADGVLKIGGLTPQTGDLAILGPPIRAGLAVAIDEINGAGGVLGKDIEFTEGDSGDGEPDLANPQVDEHINAGADVIFGAAASGVSLDVIEKITSACRIQFSPANTSPEFTTGDTHDMYFRTAPADMIQGKILAELALEDGVGTAAILARQDSYGEGLLSYVKTPFTEGGGEIAVEKLYDPDAQDFSGEIDAVVAEDPDALFMIGFDETSRVMQGLFEEGFRPDKKKIYFVDGNTSNDIGADFDE